MYSMIALLECVCEPTLSHQTASIKPLQKCGPCMPMAVLIWARSAELAKLVLKECEGIQVDDEDTRINGENLGIETDQKII